MEPKPKVTHSADKEIRDERLKHYDGDQQISDGHRLAYDGGYGEGWPTEGGGVADSSSEVKEEINDNHGSSDDQDPLEESLCDELQSAYEALQKEYLQFREIGKDGSFDDSVSGICTEFIVDDDQETSYVVVESRKGDLEKEAEDLFKLKIEGEVEYVAISSTVKKLKVAAVDHIRILEEQKALATEQTQILNKLGAAENKAAVIMKEAEKLEDICEEIVSADEILKLQNRVCKYGSCFLVQLALLLVILGFLIFHLSPSYLEVVPT